jgi:Ca2+-binding EF-hand superfamily protein
MRRILTALATTLAVVALPHYAAAQDGKAPERPDPQRMFNRLDANHDGVITKDEVPAGMPERLKNLLLRADRDHDGKITKREFMAAVHPQPANPARDGAAQPAKRPDRPRVEARPETSKPERPNPERMFNRIDANHDGVITRNEVPTGMPERLKNLLTRADRDHDGKITKREFMAAVAARHDGPRPDGKGGAANFSGGRLVITTEAVRAGAMPGPAVVARLEGRGPQPGQPAMRFGFEGRGPQPQRPAAQFQGRGPQPQQPAARPEARKPLEVAGPGTLVVNGNLVLNGGTLVINGGTLVVGGQGPLGKGMPPQGRPMARPMGKAATPAFNARVLFARLDTNKDGKLSFDEFAVGVRHMHRLLAARVDGVKAPLQRGMQLAREKMRRFQDGFAKQFQGKAPMGRPGMGPAGRPGMGLPGMGPMGPGGHGVGMGPMGMGHPGMGPMGGPGMGRPGMGPMGMGPMGHPGMGMGQFGMGPMGRAGMGHKGPEAGKHDMKKPEVCKCGAKKGEPCKCGVKKPEGCKCGPGCKCAENKHEGCKCGAACKCGTEKAAVCKCGAKKGEPCKCPMKKAEAQKPAHHTPAVHATHVEKEAAGNRSIEARLTALEKQQAEILALLRSGARPEHRGEHEGRR